MMRPDSWAAIRAAFASEATWVVRDVEGEKGGRMWPAGKYVPQTRKEPADAVRQWVKEGGSIDNEDIVLFITLGAYLPRLDAPLQHLSHLFTFFYQAQHTSRDQRIGRCKSPQVTLIHTKLTTVRQHACRAYEHIIQTSEFLQNQSEHGCSWKPRF